MEKTSPVALLFALVCGVGCATTGKIAKIATPQELAHLKEHAVDRIRFDFASNCKIRVSSKNINHSGRCSILLTSDSRMRFTLNTPFGGAVMISYMDREVIQVLNRQEQTFFHGANNEQNRRRAFTGLPDLNVQEYREVFWGRSIKRDRSALEFHLVAGRPTAIRKSGSNQKLSIRYLKWQKVLGIDMPRTILLENQSGNATVKIALTGIRLGTIAERNTGSLFQECHTRW